jgi:hypothetical protein
MAIGTLLIVVSSLSEPGTRWRLAPFGERAAQFRLHGNQGAGVAVVERALYLRHRIERGADLTRGSRRGDLAGDVDVLIEPARQQPAASVAGGWSLREAG